MKGLKAINHKNQKKTKRELVIKRPLNDSYLSRFQMNN